MINIEYKDISLTAKDDSSVSCNQKQPYSNLDLLKQDNVTYPKLATLEKNLWKLDGSFENFPDDPSTKNIALWSDVMSDGEGNILVSIDINFINYESAVGLVLKFGSNTEDYPDSIRITWYQNDTVLSQKEFVLNSSEFFCENAVASFNKITIECLSTNRPYRYIKFEDITYGIVRNFGEDELRNVELLEDLSLTSEELRINTLDFTLSNKKNVDFIFQKKQPLKITRNDELLGVFFIKSSKRKSRTLYEITSQDYIGMMDRMIFADGTYTNKNVAELVGEIMGNIPYELDESLQEQVLSGTLEECTCREALLQVAFALCAVVDTSRSANVKIYRLSNTISNTIEEGIYQGVEFGTEDRITEVRLTLNDGTVLSKRNPVLEVDALDNIIEFSGALIDANNGQAVLDYLYDYYVANGNTQTSMKFIVNDEKCGDIIEYETEYLGTKKGRITQMKFGFNSLKFVAKAEIKELV